MARSLGDTERVERTILWAKTSRRASRAPLAQEQNRSDVVPTVNLGEKERRLRSTQPSPRRRAAQLGSTQRSPRRGAAQLGSTQLSPRRGAAQLGSTQLSPRRGAAQLERP